MAAALRTKLAEFFGPRFGAAKTTSLLHSYDGRSASSTTEDVSKVAAEVLRDIYRDEVVQMWFGEQYPQRLKPDPRWFQKSESMDKKIRDEFGALIEVGLEGGLQPWVTDGVTSRLALVLILDQFTRNCFRDTAKAFAGDAMALKIAKDTTEEDLMQLPELAQVFASMPLMHSEELSDHDLLVERFKQLIARCPDYESTKFVSHALDFGYQHMKVLQRFGRYPHRNAALGRESTPTELEYLKEGGGF